MAVTQIKIAPNATPEQALAAVAALPAAVTTPATTGFARFSMNGRSEEMRQKIADQVEVLPRLALQGQWTTFYAAPNTGKTLLVIWLLKESIRRGAIDGNKVFYANCDDTYRGFVEKLELAEAVGFQMGTDGENGFRAADLLPEMQRSVREGTAHGEVVILDTLKKFIGLMDKQKQSEANKIIRRYVMAGGTVIALAHVNKHRNVDGDLVYQGTTDQIDDADCAYIMDVTKRFESHAVTFTNQKLRGDVAIKYGLEYRNGAGMTWGEKLETVHPMNDAQIEDAARADRVAAMLERDERLIAAALTAIGNGATGRTQLIAAIREETGEGRKRVLQMLGAHAGRHWRDGHRWIVTVGDKNAHSYTALTPPPGM